MKTLTHTQEDEQEFQGKTKLTIGHGGADMKVETAYCIIGDHIVRPIGKKPGQEIPLGALLQARSTLARNLELQVQGFRVLGCMVQGFG